MFWKLVEGKVNIPRGELNYLSFGKGQKNLIEQIYEKLLTVNLVYRLQLLYQTI